MFLYKIKVQGSNYAWNLKTFDEQKYIGFWNSSFIQTSVALKLELASEVHKVDASKTLNRQNNLKIKITSICPFDIC